MKNYLRENILRVIALFCLSDMAKRGYVDRNNGVYEWRADGRLFVFFVWYLTEQAKRGGLDLTRGGNNLNYGAVCEVVRVQKIERAAKQEFEIGEEPKGAEEIKEIVKKHLQTIIKL